MKLLREIVGLGAANSVYLICQLAVLSLLTWLTDIATVAAFGFIMIFVQPLFMLLRMGLRANLATDARRQFAYPTFLMMRAIASIALFVAVTLIIAILRPELLMLAVPLALMNAVEMHSDLCYGVMQRAGRVNLVARSLLLRGPATVLFFGGVLAATGDAQLAFWTQSATWLLVLWLHDFPAVRQAGETVRLDTNITRLRALFKNTSLLGLGHFFASLQMNLPRFMVDLALGINALALFTTVSTVHRASIGLFATLEQSLGWRLSRMWANDDQRSFFRMLLAMLSAALLLALAGTGLAALLGRPFLGFVFGPAYTEGYALFVWISAAIGVQLLTSVLQTAITAQRRFQAFGHVQLLLLALTLPLAFVGLQLGGLEGVGASVFVVNLIRLVILTLLLKGYARKPTGDQI